jgi:Epoxide hydrolase N terminus
MISVMTTANGEIRPFRVEISQESLDDLRGRLNRVRWASEVPGPAPEGYGVSLAWVRRLTERDIIPPSIGFLPQMSQYFAGLRGDRSPNLIAVGGRIRHNKTSMSSSRCSPEKGGRVIHDC